MTASGEIARRQRVAAPSGVVTRGGVAINVGLWPRRRKDEFLRMDFGHSRSGKLNDFNMLNDYLASQVIAASNKSSP